jgi:hypothetical protein
MRFAALASRLGQGKIESFSETVSLDLGQREPGCVEVLIVPKGADALEDDTPLAIPEE